MFHARAELCLDSFKVLFKSVLLHFVFFPLPKVLDDLNLLLHPHFYAFRDINVALLKLKIFKNQPKFVNMFRLFYVILEEKDYFVIQDVKNINQVGEMFLYAIARTPNFEEFLFLGREADFSSF